jgi:hypothetical protein
VHRRQNRNHTSTVAMVQTRTHTHYMPNPIPTSSTQALSSAHSLILIKQPNSGWLPRRFQALVAVGGRYARARRDTNISLWRSRALIYINRFAASTRANRTCGCWGSHYGRLLLKVRMLTQTYTHIRMPTHARTHRLVSVHPVQTIVQQQQQQQQQQWAEGRGEGKEREQVSGKPGEEKRSWG